jgi:hypothetical protein
LTSILTEPEMLERIPSSEAGTKFLDGWLEESSG